MDLPKFTPGQVVLLMNGDMLTVSTSYLRQAREGDNRLYMNEDRSMTFDETSVSHVLNGGYWLPVEGYNPPVVPDRILDTSIFDKMMEDDPAETEWLKQNLKPRKIEVKDGEEEL